MMVIMAVTPWLHMPVSISSVTIIVDSMGSPVRVAAFPSMKTIQPEWITDQPDITGSQIVVLVTNDTDVFVTIPGVTIGHHYRHLGRRSHHHWCRGHDDKRLERHPYNRLNDTA